MISIVIPARDVTPLLRARAARLAAHAAVREVLVVRPLGAGGSLRRRASAPRRILPGGVLVLEAPLGRAAQMNKGAEVAVAGHLLFLHADTSLGHVALSSLARALERDPGRAHAFALDFDSPRRSYRALATIARWRDRVVPYPLGDQALAIERGLFLSLGGFQDLPLFEDVRLLHVLLRRRLLRVLPDRIQTSPSRFERRGIVRTLTRNLALLIAHAVRVSPRRLARAYYSEAYVRRWHAADPSRGVPRRPDRPLSAHARRREASA